MKNETFVEHLPNSVACDECPTCASCAPAKTQKAFHEHDKDERSAILRMSLSGVILILTIALTPWMKNLGEAPIELIPLMAAYIIVGYPVLRGAFRDLVKGRLFNELFLMAIASLGAFAIGEPHEAVAVMLFYSIGEWFQDRAVRRSRRSISRLMDLRPEFARVFRTDTTTGSEREALVAPEEVTVGEIVEVRPGERVPLDGIIVEGSGFLDTSSLTGESLPLEGAPGTELKAGFVSQSGLFRVRVSAPFGKSSVARILALVQDAAERKAPTEKFITKFAAIYTPAVVGAAAILAFVPPLLLPGAQFSEWLHRALILLVISCPCALVISIPLGYFGGVGAASHNKVLVKGASALDALLKLNTVVFDKTGTLTEGKFELSEISPVQGFEKSELLSLAAAVERYSSHPLALAIQKAAKAQEDVLPEHQEVDSLVEERGMGVSAIVGGRRVVAGNLTLLERKGISALPALSKNTAVYVAVDGWYAGYIAASDTLKEGAADVVADLKSLGIKRVLMLSGDRRETAEKIASEAGLDGFWAGLLPEDKLAKVESFKAMAPKGSKVAFVGDGMNDAPVLAGADLGIAMGGLGSDAAIEASDIVIMDDDLTRLPAAIRIAQSTRRIVLQNIVFALAVKLGFMALGAAGVASMWEAVIADVGVALLAVLNATRASAIKNGRNYKANIKS